MIKGRFDTRTWQEVVGDLIMERTTFGDAVELRIKYNGKDRPHIVLSFATTDPDRQGFVKEEEITTFLPDKPYYYIIDDTTGKPIEGEFQKGHPDWHSFVNSIGGLGPEIQKICRTGGRQFTYREEQ